eukprot:scaffold7783_cov85-Skeletonema_dohrnii-CCMP3373.AAC.2
MSESGGNYIRRQSAEDELNSHCQSESISEDGIREIIERHKLTPHHVSDYKFFRVACYNRRVTEGIIRCLLEYFPSGASATDEHGQLPLHLALCNTVTLNIIQLLIDADPDSVRSVDEDGDVPLHHLCMNEELDETAALKILELLIEKHPQAVRHADDVGFLPIHAVCRNPNVTVNIIQLLIDAAPESVCSVERVGYTPLHYLCMNEELDEAAALGILKLLLEKQPEAVRHVDNDGGLPVLNAASGGRSPEFCRVLIESYPGSERMKDGNGNLPLHMACGNNTLATVEYLYKLYPDAINHATNSTGCYPIHYVITNLIHRTNLTVAVDIVKFLLDSNPNVKLQKVGGEDSLLDFACSLEYNDLNTDAALEIIKAIYDAYPEAIEDDELEPNMIPVMAFINTELHYARQATNHRLMTTPDGDGQLPLHIALHYNVRLGSIKLIVKGNPAAVQSLDNHGALPLHVACVRHDSASVVQYLLGLDMGTLRAVDYGNNTALHYACRGAKYDTIAILLEKYGAVSVSKRNAHGKLPIDLLWESSAVFDRESIEYTESVFRLFRAYPEMVMGTDIQMQSASAAHPSQNGKKRSTPSTLTAVKANVNNDSFQVRAALFHPPYITYPSFGEVRAVVFFELRYIACKGTTVRVHLAEAKRGSEQREVCDMLRVKLNQNVCAGNASGRMLALRKDSLRKHSSSKLSQSIIS